MKEIALTKGFKAIVDDEDFEFLSKFKWTAAVRPNVRAVYARTTIKQPSNLKRKKWKTVSMHRYMLKMNDPKVVVDHINGDGLDNRRSNLRVCTQAQNTRNARKFSTRLTSHYRGVHFDKSYGRKKWRASIRVDGKLINIGRFSDERSAALAYNEAAVKYFGEFARPNEIR